MKLTVYLMADDRSGREATLPVEKHPGIWRQGELVDVFECLQQIFPEPDGVSYVIEATALTNRTHVSGPQVGLSESNGTLVIDHTKWGALANKGDRAVTYYTYDDVTDGTIKIVVQRIQVTDGGRDDFRVTVYKTGPSVAPGSRHFWYVYVTGWPHGNDPEQRLLNFKSKFLESHIHSTDVEADGSPVTVSRRKFIVDQSKIPAAVKNAIRNNRFIEVTAQQLISRLYERNSDTDRSSTVTTSETVPA